MGGPEKSKGSEHCSKRNYLLLHFSLVFLLLFVLSARRVTSNETDVICSVLLRFFVSSVLVKMRSGFVRVKFNNNDDGDDGLTLAKNGMIFSFSLEGNGQMKC